MKEWTPVALFVVFGLALVALYCWYVPVSAEEYAGTEEAQEYIVSPDVEPEDPAPPGEAGSMAEDLRMLRYIAEMVYNVWCPLGLAVVFLRGVYRWFYGTYREGEVENVGGKSIPLCAKYCLQCAELLL